MRTTKEGKGKGRKGEAPMVSADNTCPQCSPILFPSAGRFVQGFSTCPRAKEIVCIPAEALVVSAHYTSKQSEHSFTEGLLPLVCMALKLGSQGVTLVAVFAGDATQEKLDVADGMIAKSILGSQ